MDVDFDHLVKVVFVRLLHCRVVSSPFPHHGKLTLKELGIMLHLLRVENKLFGILLYERFVFYPLSTYYSAIINISVDSPMLVLYFLF